MLGFVYRISYFKTIQHCIYKLNCLTDHDQLKFVNKLILNSTQLFLKQIHEDETAQYSLS